MEPEENWVLPLLPVRVAFSVSTPLPTLTWPAEAVEALLGMVQLGLAALHLLVSSAVPLNSSSNASVQPAPGALNRTRPSSDSTADRQASEAILLRRHRSTGRRAGRRDEVGSRG